jgi:hypothetical protein
MIYSYYNMILKLLFYLLENVYLSRQRYTLNNINQYINNETGFI